MLFLFYKLDFVDPISHINNLRDSMDINHQHAKDLIAALNKVDEWTTVAMEQGISGRRISKRVFCFPKEQCKEKTQGNTSTDSFGLLTDLITVGSSATETDTSANIYPDDARGDVVTNVAAADGTTSTSGTAQAKRTRIHWLG